MAETEPHIRRSDVPGLVAGSERVHIEGLEDEVARLRHGLGLIVREAEQFPSEDGIGAGTMARNLLAGVGR